MSAYSVDDETFLDLHHAGLASQEIADRLGITRRTVLRRRVRLGVARHTPGTTWRPTPEWEAQARTLLEDGASLREIARTLHCDRATVTRRFKGMGWTLNEAGSHSQTMRRANEILRKTA